MYEWPGDNHCDIGENEIDFVLNNGDTTAPYLNCQYFECDYGDCLDECGYCLNSGEGTMGLCNPTESGNGQGINGCVYCPDGETPTCPGEEATYCPEEPDPVEFTGCINEHCTADWYGTYGLSLIHI